MWNYWNCSPLLHQIEFSPVNTGFFLFYLLLSLNLFNNSILCFFFLLNKWKYVFSTICIVSLNLSATSLLSHPKFISKLAWLCLKPCLFKWHYNSKNKELNNNEQEYILNLLMKWIGIELKKIQISYFCLL